MGTKTRKERHLFEMMLIVVSVGMAFLMYRMGAYKLVALNLFYLPIVLSGYFLGRGSAGILALFSAVTVGIVTTLDATGFAAFNSPVMVFLALVVWAAALGLTAILIGTLSDERAKKVEELHEAYVGVIDVLSAYLHSADPDVKARSIRVAELSQRVAEKLRLSRKQIDDIRVAALLHDMNNVEITTKLISKAVNTIEAADFEQSAANNNKYTFLGTDLVESLGSVLHGAVPLLLNQDDALRDVLVTECGEGGRDIPTGARIIRAVREYDALTVKGHNHTPLSPREALRAVRGDPSSGYDSDVLGALEGVVSEVESESAARSQPVLA